MKIKVNLKPNKKQKKEQIKKRDKFFENTKIAFMHFDENGKINLLDDLQDLNWTEYGKNTKM